MLPLVAIAVVLMSSPVLHTHAGASTPIDGAVSHPHQSQTDDVFLKALLHNIGPLIPDYDTYSQPTQDEATPREYITVRNSFHQGKPKNSISVPTYKGQGQNKRDFWTPQNRYKRVRVCPFLNRVGFPLGGCLYSYIKPAYKPPPPTPKPASKPKPIPRPVIMWQPYQARWPEFYFLGGALGRR
ncbi:uncharacterized protein LOC124148778 [Haliotis rufescens]|uniref:uncharacterized protein LOC124148778 n=1 Tax=Haliotis rufescens TaxID=6454 RepID=UPI00201E95E4|nr:uncharacterized protein LOC124148778 [Haliotis rufescens]